MQLVGRVKFPDDPEEFADFRLACQKYVLPGYVPPSPIFSRNASVITAGSCFAEHISAALNGAGVGSKHLFYGEDYNSASATTALFDEVLSGARGPEILEALKSADLLILTVGVAVVAFLDGKPVLHVTKQNMRDLKWGVLPPEQIARYMMQIIERVRSVNPSISFVLTESPLPLNAAIHHESVVGQDCLSKSCIRVGLEMTLQQGLERVFYWPSFEMVRWLAPHRGRAFGLEGANNRHIPKSMVDQITALFIETYFHGEGAA